MRIGIIPSFIITCATWGVANASNVHAAGVEKDIESSSKPKEPLLSLRSSTLTGDWSGHRPRLADAGLRVHVYLNSQYQAVLDGGLDTGGAGKNAGSLDTIITLDLHRLGWVENADVLLHLQSNLGAGINPRTGTLSQVNDDADNRDGFHVAQLWYRHRFLDNRVALMLGFLDFQTIVDRNEAANSEDKQFLNQSLDNNPLLPLNIGLGAVLTVRPCDWATTIVGVGDAQSRLYRPGFSTAFHDENWWFGYLEQDFHVRLPGKRGPLPGNYRVGLVYDPRPRTVFELSAKSPRQKGHDYGFYVSMDQQVLRETEGDEQGLTVFGRFGYRRPETNRMSRFWSAGCAYRGLIPDRNQDVLGFGFSLQRVSHDYRHFVDDRWGDESVYELYYALHVSDWLTVTPDLQYIDNPGASGTQSHAIAAGVRVRVSF